MKTKQTNLTHRTVRALASVSTLAAIVLALLTSLTSASAAGRNPNPGILPPNATPYGKTYGEWGAAWWQWALSMPTDRSALTDLTGEFFGENQSGPVWFRGTFANNRERTSTMPAGKALFMPVFNLIYGAGVYDCDPTVPGVPCDIPTLQAAAARNTEAATILEVTIDGVPVQNVTDYRAASPEPFTVTYPDNSVVGVPAGTYSPNVTDGYWLMIAPLSRGEHTIQVHVLAPNTDFGTLEFRSVTHLTVK